MSKILLRDTLGFSSFIDPNAMQGKPAYKGILYEKSKDEFGNDMFTKIGENTVVVGGAVFALEAITGATSAWRPKTINQLLNIEAGNSGGNVTPRVVLFGAGVGGAGNTLGSVKAKDIKSNTLPELVPLRATTSLTGKDAGKYFMKKAGSDGKQLYYLKEFSSQPVIKTFWKDSASSTDLGAEVGVGEDISTTNKGEALQSYVEFTLDFNQNDVREYFESQRQLDMARFNTIGLFTGKKNGVSGGGHEYVDVRLFSYLNFDNKSLKIKTASQYAYRILSLT